MPEKINESTGNNCDASANNKITPAFNAVGIGLKISDYPHPQSYLNFNFDHIVIKATTRAEFDHNLFEALDLIDITDVTDYPEGCIAFIDASNGLTNEFFYYLVNRAHNLLTIVNMNYTKYENIEDCAAYKDLMTTLIFIHKYSEKFNCYNNTKFIKFVLVRRYDVSGVFLDIVVVYDVLDIAAPKPISIFDNPRYKDYDKTVLE